MKKKLLSLVLVVAMLASMLVIAPIAGATETAPATVTTLDATGVVGQTVSVDVVLESEQQFFSYQLAYTYDNTKLEFVDVTFPAGGSGAGSNKAGDEFKDACAKGPYDLFTQAYATPFAANTEHVIATINFTALAAGTTSVEIVATTVENGLVQTNGDPLNFVYLTSDTSVYYNGEEIACGGSTVTILPEGYTLPVEIPAEDWSYDEEYASIWGLASKWESYTGTLVIPSEINGMPVKAIDVDCFYGFNFSTVIVPASVSDYIDAVAFHECYNLKDIYILNSEVPIESDAIGYEGGAYKKGSYNGGATLYLVDGVPPTTIHAPAGSTAAAYAAKDNFPFVAESLYTLTVNDESYFVSSNVTAPAASVVDGGYAIAWTDDDGNTYAPGAAMNLTGDTTLEPVTIALPEMNTGVQFKIGEGVADSQMRFVTILEKAALEKLDELGATYTMGTIITPALYVSLAGGLNKTALDALGAANKDKEGVAPQTYIDVVAKGVYGSYTDANGQPLDENHYAVAGSISGFKAGNIDVAYAAAFYLTITLNGQTTTIYTDFDLDACRSVGDAIDAMTKAAYHGLTETQATNLKEWIAGNN